jgi:hypothetical protein
LIPRDKVGQAKRWAEFHWTFISNPFERTRKKRFGAKDTSVTPRVRAHLLFRPITQRRIETEERKTVSEANEARRQAMRELLHRKDR